MITGKYRLFKNNEEVFESENIITSLGKDLLLKYLSGTISSWGDSLAVGCGYDGSTAASSSDSTLKFEMSRSSVNLKSPNITTVSTTTNGSATSGTYTFVVTSATGVVVGMAVSGTNISTYAVVTNVSGTTITVSHAHTNTVATSTPVVFTLRKLIFKASLDPSLIAVINEIGLFSYKNLANNGQYDNDIITRFDEGIDNGTTNILAWNYSTGVSTSTTSKLGASNIILTNSFAKLGTAETLATYSSNLTYPGTLGMSLLQYNRGDTIQLAVASTSGTTPSGTIEITFYDDQSTPGTLKWTIAADTYTTTTKIKTATISSLTAGGNFNYNISAIKVYTPLTLSFDALRIERTGSVNNLAGLVSRSVLSSPVTKTLGDSLDIQYELNLGL